MNKTSLTAGSAAPLLPAGFPCGPTAGKAVPAQAVEEPAAKAAGASPAVVFGLASSGIFSQVKLSPLNYTTFQWFRQ